ncbi:MAG: hypothetical protein RL885_21420 [Planctomycetota bacterium]
MKHWLWMASLTLLLLAAEAPVAIAQNEVDPEKVAEFWRRFQDARGLGDQRAMQRVVRNSKKEGRAQYSNLVSGWATGNAELLEGMKALATTWELAFGDSKLREQVEAFEALSDADRERLGKARQEYSNCVNLFTKSQTSRKAEDVQAAVAKLSSVGNDFAETNDWEYAGHCYSMLARCYQAVASEVDGADKETALQHALDSFEKCAELYKKADWSSDMVWVESQIKMLKDPEKNKPAANAGGAEPAGDDAGKGAAGTDEGWTTIQLEYVGRDPSSRWECPNYADGEQYFLWYSIVVRDWAEPDKEDFVEKLPFGDAKLVRDGAQYLIDDDGDGQTDRRVKIGGRPQPVDFVLGKGEDAVKYASTMMFGSQQESHFGIGDLNFQPTDLYSQIFYRRACYMEGELDGEPIVIIDDNDTGGYALPLTGWNNPRNNEELFHADAYVFGGRARRATPLGDFIQAGDKLYQIKVALHGSSIQVKEIPDVKRGTAKLEVTKLRAKPHYLVIRNLDTYKGAMFDISQERRGMEVPVGKYEICYGVIQEGSGKRTSKIQILKGKSEPFEIKEGEETTVEIGGPFRFDDFSFFGGAGRYVLEAETIKVYGAKGELYTLFYDDPPLPTVSVRSGKRVVLKGEEMQTPVRDDYNANATIVWKGINLETEIAGDGPFQTRLMAKHPVLGVISSDWQDSK